MSERGGEQARLRVRSVPINLGPRDLASLLPDTDVVAWQHGRDGMVGWGEAWRADFPSAHQFRAAQRAWRDLAAAAETSDEVGAFGSGLIGFGSFAFDPQSAAGGTLIVPRVLIGRRGKVAWLTTVDAETTADAILTVETTAPDGGGFSGAVEGTTLSDGALWAAEVEAVLERIDDGDAEKVVLAREVRVTAETTISPARLLRRLAGKYRTTHNYAVDSLVGATPELLVTVRGGRVASTILAGTVPLPPNASEPEIERLAERLIESQKDLAEHAHAVDSVANALAPLCTKLEVNGPEILELPNVLHLVTDLKARYASRSSSVASLFLAESLHPTAAVCGTPPAAALELIREFEDFDRGRYSGPVGWLNAAGDGEWGIALRCAKLQGGNAKLYAGCGIVAGSNPATELLESEAKLAPLRWALLGDRPGAPASADGAAAAVGKEPDRPALHLL